MSNNSKGRPFTHAGIIINKNLNNNVRYRFLMKRKDSTSDEKFMSDVSISQELMFAILVDTRLLNKKYCYMEYKTHGTRFELISSKYIQDYSWSGANWYYEQIITMRDNKNNIEYVFNTKDRFQEVGLNNIPKAKVKIMRYEDIDFSKSSLIECNYPTNNEEPKEEITSQSEECTIKTNAISDKSVWRISEMETVEKTQEVKTEVTDISSLNTDLLKRVFPNLATKLSSNVMAQLITALGSKLMDFRDENELQKMKQEVEMEEKILIEKKKMLDFCSI